MSLQNKPIVILGTGRSGTSAIANILHHLGVHMGDIFVAADRTNPYGHFEDIDFVQIHRHIMHSQMSAAEVITTLRTLWSTKQNAAQQHKYRWGFKDPLTTNLVSFYLDSGFEMDIIWSYRDFKDVQESSHKAYGWSADMSHKNLHGRLEIMENLARQHKVALKINFKDLLSAPHEIIAHIIEAFHLTPTAEQVEKALQNIHKTD